MRIVLPLVSTDKMDFDSVAIRIVWRLECVWISFFRQIPVVQKRYDTVHGRFKHDVKIGEKDELIVNGNKIKCIQASREGPKALPWKDWVTGNRNNWRVHTSLSNRKRLGMIRYFQCKATWCYMYMFTVHVKVRSFTGHVHIDVYVCTLGHGRGVCHWVHWSLRGGWEGRAVCWYITIRPSKLLPPTEYSFLNGFSCNDSSQYSSYITEAAARHHIRKICFLRLLDTSRPALRRLSFLRQEKATWRPWFLKIALWDLWSLRRKFLQMDLSRLPFFVDKSSFILRNSLFPMSRP